MPPRHPACSTSGDGEAPPRVLSPAPRQTFVLLGDGEGSQQNLLLEAGSRMETLYWFVDGALFATSAPLEHTFWPLERGTHSIVCSDGAGRSSSVVVTVK